MRNPKILLFDIETSPNLAYVWGKYEQNVLAYKREWQLISIAYKWLGEKEITVHSQRTFTQKQLVNKLWHIIDKADITIAHNGDEFDTKKAAAKFIEFGLNPPSKVQQIDTCKLAKGSFKFNSNKLDDLGSLLGVGRKIHTGGFDLWLGCMAGKVKSWELMEKYNKQDVALLERVYLKLRPWTKNHPNLSNLSNRPSSCPRCGSTRLRSRGILSNSTTRYRSWNCWSCGGWCRSRLAEKGE